MVRCEREGHETEVGREKREGGGLGNMRRDIKNI